MKIVSTTPRTNQNLENFQKALKDTSYIFNEIFPKNQHFNSMEMKKILSDCYIAIVGDDQIDSNALEHAKNLKHIIKWGSGVDSIDIEYAKQQNIVVTNTPGVLGKYVAEYALGVILATKRNLFEYSNSFKNNKLWNKLPGDSLFNKTVGLIGYGNIGQEIAVLLKPFSCNILYHDPYIQTKNNASSVQLEELYFNSDILILSAKLTPETHEIINKDVLLKLKSNCLLINISRGELINEQDVFDFVDRKQLKYLFLDVFKKEPPELSNYYTENNHVNFSQHNASNSKNAIEEVNNRIIKIVEELIK